MLEEDHRQARELLARLSGDSRRVLGEVFDELERVLAVHSAVEIEHFYPLVHKHVEGGIDFAKQGRLDHEEIDMTLYRLRHVPLGNDEFAAELAKLRRDVAEHLRDEEEKLFAPLRHALGQDGLADLARHLEVARRHAPTHPHPSAPKSALGSRLAHRVVGAVDRLSDRRRRG